MGEKNFSLEELNQAVGGILTKVQDTVITSVAPPKLADENTLARNTYPTLYSGLKNQSISAGFLS